MRGKKIYMYSKHKHKNNLYLEFSQEGDGAEVATCSGEQQPVARKRYSLYSHTTHKYAYKNTSVPRILSRRRRGRGGDVPGGAVRSSQLVSGAKKLASGATKSVFVHNEVSLSAWVEGRVKSVQKKLKKLITQNKEYRDFKKKKKKGQFILMGRRLGLCQQTRLRHVLVMSKVFKKFITKQKIYELKIEKN